MRPRKDVSHPLLADDYCTHDCLDLQGSSRKEGVAAIGLSERRLQVRCSTKGGFSACPRARAALWLRHPSNLCRAGLSSLTHGSVPVWPLGGSAAGASGRGHGGAGGGGRAQQRGDPGASSLAQQVGSVMPTSAAFLLGAGSGAGDPNSALLLDTNIQVGLGGAGCRPSSSHVPVKGMSEDIGPR